MGSRMDRPDAREEGDAPGASAPDPAPVTRALRYESESHARDGAPEPSGQSDGITLPPLQTIVNGKYCIDAELGRGGMGAVYRAHHVELRKPVALKWLLPEYASDPDSRQRFSREARAASNIKHDNVVDVYDYGIDAERGVPYIVMELLTGISLGEHLRQRGRLEPREALAIMLPCMRGVAAAHKLGIVHRDLKPENIFLCEGDELGARRVKVLDFGVAAALEPGAGADAEPIITRTDSRSIVGTVLYMPAEQLVGGTVDARADVYALGVILYELLSGKLPNHAATPDDVTAAILDRHAVPLAARVPGLDPELSASVQRAMAPRKADRFADLPEMIAAFQALAVRFEGNTASAASLGSARTRAWSIAAGLALVSAVLWATWSLRAPAPTQVPVVMPAPVQQRTAWDAPAQAEHGVSAATDPAAPVVLQPTSPPRPTGVNGPASPVELAAPAPATTDPDGRASRDGRRRKPSEPRARSAERGRRDATLGRRSASDEPRAPVASPASPAASAHAGQPPRRPEPPSDPKPPDYRSKW